MTIDKKSLINWVGGKRLLRKTIEPLIPTDIKSYIEPFGGGGVDFILQAKMGRLRDIQRLRWKISKFIPNS